MKETKSVQKCWSCDGIPYHCVIDFMCGSLITASEIDIVIAKTK